MIPLQYCNIRSVFSDYVFSSLLFPHWRSGVSIMFFQLVCGAEMWPVVGGFWWGSRNVYVKIMLLMIILKILYWTYYLPECLKSRFSQFSSKGSKRHINVKRAVRILSFQAIANEYISSVQFCSNLQSRLYCLYSLSHSYITWCICGYDWTFDCGRAVPIPNIVWPVSLVLNVIPVCIDNKIYFHEKEFGQLNKVFSEYWFWHLTIY